MVGFGWWLVAICWLPVASGWLQVVGGSKKDTNKEK